MWILIIITASSGMSQTVSSLAEARAQVQYLRATSEVKSAIAKNYNGDAVDLLSEMVGRH